MAEESLFGGSASDYMKARQARELDEDLAFGQLPLAGQIVAQGAQSGRLFGSGLGTLMGGVDPELQKIKTMDTIFQSLTSEERANPAVAFSAISDKMAEFKFLGKESLLYKMKAADLAKQSADDKDASDVKQLTIANTKIKLLAGLAQGTYSALEMAKGTPEQEDFLWKEFLKGASKIIPPEELATITTLSADQRLSYLEKTRKTVESMAQEVALEMQAKRIAADERKAKIIASAKVVATQKDFENDVALQKSRLDALTLNTDKSIRAKYQTDLLHSATASVDHAQRAVKEVSDKLLNWADTIKVGGFSKEEQQELLINLQRDKLVLEQNLRSALISKQQAVDGISKLSVDPLQTPQVNSSSIGTREAELSQAIAQVKKGTPINDVLSEFNSIFPNSKMSLEEFTSKVNGTSEKPSEEPLTKAEQDDLDFRVRQGSEGVGDWIKNTLSNWHKAKYAQIDADAKRAQELIKNPKYFNPLPENQKRNLRKMASMSSAKWKKQRLIVDPKE